MAKKASRRLVIDASVARSATFHDNPTSSACRKFLQEVLKVCHKVLLTREIETEWEYAALHVVSKADQMRIRFLVAWMIEMQSKAKILRPQVPRDESLRTKINHLGLPENHRQDLSEDLHLVEAALATDRVVISRDDAVHTLLRGISGNYQEIRKVVWCNPVTLGDEALGWLRTGARVVKVWQLGSKRQP